MKYVNNNLTIKLITLLTFQLINSSPDHRLQELHQQILQLKQSFSVNYDALSEIERQMDELNAHQMEELSSPSANSNQHADPLKEFNQQIEQLKESFLDQHEGLSVIVNKIERLKKYQSDARASNIMTQLDQKEGWYDIDNSVNVLALSDGTKACIGFNAPKDLNNESLFKAVDECAKAENPEDMQLMDIDEIGLLVDAYDLSFIVEAFKVTHNEVTRGIFGGYIVNRNKKPVRLINGVMKECSKQEAINYIWSVFGFVGLINFTLALKPFQAQNFDAAYCKATGQNLDDEKEPFFSQEELTDLLQKCKTEQDLFENFALPTLIIQILSGWLSLKGLAPEEEKNFLEELNSRVAVYSVGNFKRSLEAAKRGLKAVKQFVDTYA